MVELNDQKVAIRCEKYMQHTISWPDTVTIGPGTTTAVDELLSDAAKLGSPEAGRAGESSYFARRGSVAAATAALSADAQCSLPAGRCNLYQFPRVSFADEPLQDTRQPTPSELRVLCALMAALLTDQAGRYHEHEDVTAAKPIHALLIANTPSAIALSSHVIRQVPRHMLDAHGDGMFYGENCLHVLCANGREAEACAMFDVVADQLPRQEVHRLLRMQAVGSFFRSPPVDFYGSTPVSYACMFGMKELLGKMLKWGGSEIDLNDPKQFGCHTSGFLPIHCLVASKLPRMVDWLLTLRGHPDLLASRARLNVRVAEGANMRFHELTPLQLATKLGDHAMFRFLLKKSAKTDWRWGPMTQKRFNLSEIDSINPGGCHVMELVCRLDATQRTQEMLGLGPDSKRGNFMQGFIYALYVAKYESFGKYVFTLLMLLDLAYLVTLLLVLDNYRDYCTLSPLHLIVPLLVLSMLQLGSEGAIVLAWLRNFYTIAALERASGVTIGGSVAGIIGEAPSAALRRTTGALDSVHRALRRVPWGALWAQLSEHNLRVKLLSLGSSISTGVILLYLGRRKGDGEVALGFDAAQDAKGFQDGWVVCAPQLPQPDLLSFLLSISFFCHSIAFLMELVNLPWAESIGKYARFLIRMLGTILNWLVVFVVLLLVFSVTMSFIYPVEPQFRYTIDAMIALWLLATTGEPIEGFPPRYSDMLPTDQWPSVGLWGTPNGIAFFVLFLLWLYVGLILLLNLLIAQMSDKFDELKGKAALEHKLGFARRVLRSELFTAMLLGVGFAERVFRVGDLEVGSEPPTYYFRYVEVGKNVEGRSLQKHGEGLFEDNSEGESDADNHYDSDGD